MTKKGMEMTLSTIAVAVLVVIVIVILSLMFKEKITKSGATIDDQQKNAIGGGCQSVLTGGICADSCPPNREPTEPESKARTWADCSGKTCCVPI